MRVSGNLIWQFWCILDVLIISESWYIIHIICPWDSSMKKYQNILASIFYLFDIYIFNADYYHSAFASYLILENDEI